MSQHDELSPAVVAAITALLAATQKPDDEPEGERAWARSGRVAPSWSERGTNSWRDGERDRGWRE